MVSNSKLLKLNIISAMLVLMASIIFLCCGFSVRLPDGVKINGEEVGGLSREQAVEKIRSEIVENLKDKTLEIKCKNCTYTYSYPEINFKDNLYSVVRDVKKGQNATAKISYYLCGIDEVISGILFAESIPVVEPYAEFKASVKPFIYHEGSDGKAIDTQRLKMDILSSVNGDFTPVTAAYVGVNRKNSLQQIKNDTALLAKFTTYYDGDNLSRSSNIRLASSKLNGKILGVGKLLSFNDIVGARLKSRGFLPAKIIENGEFTEGVGGGVCQVSTTLYNAALLSGLEVEEYHPHSLPVSYVPPSRDAMVSGTDCDLKIRNGLDCPVYICSRTGKGYVTFEFYGRRGEAEYSIFSEVTGNIAAPEEKVDDPEKARDGKDGIMSSGYLTVKRGNYKKTTLLRKDKYKPLKKLVYESEENPVEKKEEN